MNGDEIKKGLQLEKTFNPNWSVDWVKRLSTETGKVITDLSTSMLNSATVANDLLTLLNFNDEIGKLATKTQLMRQKKSSRISFASI